MVTRSSRASRILWRCNSEQMGYSYADIMQMVGQHIRKYLRDNKSAEPPKYLDIAEHPDDELPIQAHRDGAHLYQDIICNFVSYMPKQPCHMQTRKETSICLLLQASIFQRGAV